MKDFTATNWKPAYYATFYALLREVAMQHGYALAIHGSLVRDLDLIAVPWVDEPSPADVLVKALTEACGDPLATDNHKERRPHGRLAYAIAMGAGAYIDVSVMPTVARSEA